MMPRGESAYLRCALAIGVDVLDGKLEAMHRAKEYIGTGTRGSVCAKMKGKDAWENGRYIDKQSWAIMLGDDKQRTGLPMPVPSNYRRRAKRSA